MADENVKIIIDAFDRTKTAFTGIQSNLKGLQAGAANLVTAFRTLTAAAPIAALVGMIKHTADLGEQLLKISKQTGISAENLSLLRYAADQNETSIESLNGGMRFFQKALSGINDEGQDTTALLRSMGVTAKDPYEALQQLAKAFQGITDVNDRSRVAVELFGRSGRDLIPLLLDLNNALAEAKKNAHIMTDADVKALDDFGDSVKKLKANLEGLAAVTLMPLINQVNTLFSYFGKDAEVARSIVSLDHEISNIEKLLKNRSGSVFNEIFSSRQGDLEKRLNDLKVLRDSMARTDLFFSDSKSGSSAVKVIPSFSAPKGATGKTAGRTSITTDWALEMARLSKDLMQEEERDMDLRVAAWKEMADKIRDLTNDEFEVRRLKALEWYQEEQKVLGDIPELYRALQLELTQIDADALADRLKKEEEARDKSIEEIRKYWQEIEEMQEAPQITLSQGFSAGVEKYLAAIRDMGQQGEEMASSLTSSMESDFMNFFDAASEGFRNFGELAKSILYDIYQELLKILVVKPIVGGLAGGLSSIFSGISGLASGGPVRAFTPYFVGEQGPELFVPKSAGTIIPSGSAIGSTVIHNHNYYTTNNISAMDSESIDRALRKKGRGTILGIVGDDLDRNGPIRRKIKGVVV